MKKKTAKKASVADTIFNTGIGMDVHTLYIEMCGQIGGILSKDELIAEGKKLLLKRTPLEEKKKALIYLAHGNDLRSLYTIQKLLSISRN